MFVNCFSNVQISFFVCYGMFWRLSWEVLKSHCKYLWTFSCNNKAFVIFNVRAVWNHLPLDCIFYDIERDLLIRFCACWSCTFFDRCILLNLVALTQTSRKFRIIIRILSVIDCSINVGYHQDERNFVSSLVISGLLRNEIKVPPYLVNVSN